jgi:hypothetical protein
MLLQHHLPEGLALPSYFYQGANDMGESYRKYPSGTRRWNNVDSTLGR